MQRKIQPDFLTVAFASEGIKIRRDAKMANKPAIDH